MSKIKLLFSFVLSFSILSLSLQGIDDYCKCPSAQDPPTKIKDNSKLSSEEVVENGVNFGLPILVGGLVFLKNDVKVSSSYTKITDKCPTGFRLPYKSEFISMLKALGDNATLILSDVTGANFSEKFNYITSDKVYPAKTNSSDSDSYKFWGLSKSGDAYTVSEIQTNTNTQKLYSKCVQDTTNVNFKLTGIDYDLLQNSKRKISLEIKALKGILWRINGKTYSSPSIEVKNSQRGCYLLEIWGKALNDGILYDCKTVYTRANLGNNANAKFSMSKVSNLTYNFYSKRVGMIYFERPQAPIAPKSDGGYYMAYTDINTSKLHVVEFNKSDYIINDKELAYSAYPMDIIETDYGFAIYARLVDDAHHSFLLTYYSNYTKVCETTIMNNGKSPNGTTEALVFYGSGGSPLYGLIAMYTPENGKLSYGQGRLNLIFAHYNNFGAGTETRNDHTGDTYYSFDIFGTLNSAKYAWSWGSSHSLIQSHIFDGKYFISVALGDAYPEGLRVSVVDVNTQAGSYDSVRQSYPGIKEISTSSLVPDFPGNHGGNSMGRLGGVLEFENFYSIIYSVKKSDNYKDSGIYLANFNYKDGKINLIKKKTVKKKVAGKINNIRCAKYGKRILITYILNAKEYSDDEYPTYYTGNYKTETMYYLVCDTNGKVTAGPFKSELQQGAVSEDIRQLKDGSLRWGYIDTTNKLTIVKVGVPVNEASKLSGGAIFGIILALIIVLGVVGFIVYFKFIKKMEFSQMPLLNKLI